MFIFESIILISIYNHENKIVKRVLSDRRIGPHHKDIISIFYGCLLGDSHAEQHGNGTRLSISQESNRKEYILWLHSIIAYYGYCYPSIPKVQTRLGAKGKLRYILRFHTFTYSSFNELRHKWYHNNIKVIPKDIEQYLTPLAIAIWTIDDGSRVGKSIKWCTNSFTYEDCTYLSQVIYKLYKIKTSIHSTGTPNQYNIYVLKESMPNLRELIKPYMVPSMLYKLGILNWIRN
uniref:Homing endonuclease LAGLIDADG domain-containing protein n=1 Tax=Malassezia slooffiae TaxID=76776 RepID=A0A2I6QCZ7_9BASI|nr:hypothetical protein [Malassezia slooffiae]